MVLKPKGINKTIADIGYPVNALWFYCYQILLNDLSFQSHDVERT
jgi:hypothetical protein